MFTYDGRNIWSIVKSHLFRLFHRVLPDLAGDAEMVKRLCNTLGVDVVVSAGEWQPRQRAGVIGARAAGAKTVSVQRGDITGYPGWGEPLFADVIAVNGPYVSDVLVEAEIPRERIRVTGNPRFDKLVDPSAVFGDGTESHRLLGLPESAQLVAVMTNPIDLNERLSHVERYIRGVLEFARDHSDVFVVIKLHPSESDWSIYERIMTADGIENVLLLKDFDPMQLIHDSDAVITTISTTGNEAIFLGKPLVAINLTSEPDFMEYTASSTAIAARRYEDIGSAISRALYDAKARRDMALSRADFIARHAYRIDGNSTSRVVDVIEELSG
jgi:hypothetical protein